jgi:ELWxxDGT repeat protein
MLKWMLKRLGHVLGVREELNRTQLRAHLLFEQLEDRTAPSAAVLRDVNVGPTGSAPAFLNGERWFTEISSPNGQTRVFFVANDGQSGAELWMTNGTPGNAQRVRDIRQGPAESSPRFLTNVNGILFFAADDGQSGFELWRSDGTANGTTMVRDIRANGGSDPRFLVNVSGTLFFVANDGQNGFELWRSDGTSNGTAMVANINPGPNSSNPHWLLNAGGTLFFSADGGSNYYSLYGLDPSSNSPVAIAQGTVRNPRWLTYFPGMGSAGRLFFVANRWDVIRNIDLGPHIWYLDLGSNNPIPLFQDNGLFLTAVVDPTRPPNVGSFLFYRTGSGDLAALHAPTPSGRLLLDRDPFDLHNHNGVLVYSAGVDREPSYVDTRGRSLGALTAVQLANINPAGSSLLRPLYFPTDFQLQTQVWNYLGNQPTWYHWQSQVFFTTLANVLYFAANDGTRGVELWKAKEDLSEVNIVLTVNGTEIAPGARNANPRFLLAAAGSVLFSALPARIPATIATSAKNPGWRSGHLVFSESSRLDAGIYRMRQMQFIVQMDKPTLVTGTPNCGLPSQIAIRPA